MGRLADAVARYQLVGVDSPLFIYMLEAHPIFAQPAHDPFEAVTTGVVAGCTSVLTLIETTVAPFRAGLVDVADNYRSAILKMPNLAVIDIDPEAATSGARLRAKYGLRTPDALQLAACIEAGADAFVTNDRQLQRVAEIPVLLLSDFVDG